MGARFSAPVQTGPGAHPTSCTMGIGSFTGKKSGRDVTLTPHPLLVPRSRKSSAMPLLSLRAVRPVQSLSACTRVYFTFYLTCHYYENEIFVYFFEFRKLSLKYAITFQAVFGLSLCNLTTDCVTTANFSPHCDLSFYDQFT